MSIRAILWDYDGTLVDTREKNLNVSRAIIEEMTGRSRSFPTLGSLEAYDAANRRTANWRELYRIEFGFTEEQIDRAGSLWSTYQERDTTRPRFYTNIAETIASFSDYPQAIVSQNSARIIRAQLEPYGLAPFFAGIIGYEEVALNRQKPHPDGLLLAISNLAALRDHDVVLYVGDHETDAHCAHRANAELGRKAVISIGAFYEKDDAADQWIYRPDYRAYRPMDIVDIAKNLMS
jgi:HAD superfamily hydrolase (TIGR01549 family)